MFISTLPNQFITKEGEAPAEPWLRQLGRSLALPLEDSARRFQSAARVTQLAYCVKRSLALRVLCLLWCSDQVLNAQLKGERQVYLFLDETSRSYLGENFESMSSKLKLNVKNVRDVDNRELDRITGSTLFQFRELFVQKLMPNRILPINTPLVNKNTPLSLSISDPSKEAISNFWMNSPLKKKE